MATRRTAAPVTKGLEERVHVRRSVLRADEAVRLLAQELGISEDEVEGARLRAMRWQLYDLYQKALDSLMQLEPQDLDVGVLEKLLRQFRILVYDKKLNDEAKRKALLPEGELDTAPAPTKPSTAEAKSKLLQIIASAYTNVGKADES